MRPTAAQIGGAYGLAKIHKSYTDIPQSRPIIDNTSTRYSNVGKFLVNFFSLLTSDEYAVKDSFKEASSGIHEINTHYFYQGYVTCFI